MRRRSPLDVEAARRLIDYNGAVLDRYVRAARRLPWRTASRDQGIGHRSIFRTLVHILNVHEIWMGYVLPGRLAALSDPAVRRARSPRTWVEFGAYARQVRSAVGNVRQRLNARELDRPVKAPWMPGRYTVGDAVLQTSLEQAHHVGELIATFWRQNRRPPEMTWIDVNRAARSGGR